VRVECELAVRLARDLPKASAPHTPAGARAAIGEVMAAFELIEDRCADYKTSKALSLIADNSWNGGIVIGRAKPPLAAFDLLKRNGKPEATGKTDDPMGALAWLANLAVERGRPMTAGMVVITGSVVATVDIAPGEAPRLCARWHWRDIHDGDLSLIVVHRTIDDRRRDEGRRSRSGACARRRRSVVRLFDRYRPNTFGRLHDPRGSHIKAASGPALLAAAPIMPGAKHQMHLPPLV
jgi:hypothetical protein